MAEGIRMPILEKSYSGLLMYDTFEDRFNYLVLNGSVGFDTFGGRRWINQKFYRSKEWKQFRNDIIIRDNGCDLAIPDRPIVGRMYVHHIRPITPDDLFHSSNSILNPENAVLVSQSTHNALHYGSIETALIVPGERKPYDTCPWREE